MLNVFVALVIVVAAAYGYYRLFVKGSKKYSPEIEAQELLAKAEAEAKQIEFVVKTPLINKF